MQMQIQMNNNNSKQTNTSLWVLESLQYDFILL